ncbi:hypothetical protein KFL_003850040 [Klebsormidium nitens]|uniref:MYND-type domain-containing protein n=1 Tax=Klebsormidium nitens TaxID=105231 RepID=A0A1Y1IBE7_KLENI|nr:hypothetical protein KFL_003850040 [Klebsormidium nitens]|eukprot:GAQ87883.1 hypothetical protein KFL_003850040 [Klebsormidium nitens]
MDTRCVAFVLKEFPDVAQVARAIFTMRMSNEGMDLQVAFEPQKAARMEIGVLSYAESIKGEDEEAYVQVYFLCCGIVYNAAATERADLRTLRSELYELVENVLANCQSKERIDVATRLLYLTLKENEDILQLSDYSSLESSLLALYSLGNQVGGALQRFILFAAQQFWRNELHHLSAEQMHAALTDRFEADEGAVRRSVQLRKVFSTPSEESCGAHYVFVRKATQKARKERADSVDLETSNLPLKQRHVYVERRKCSNTRCRMIESVAGSYKKCGRCKIAVYCSRECQKLAWKEGHKELCR